MNDRAVLETCMLFRGFSPEEIKAFLCRWMGEIKVYQKEQAILEEGSKADTFGIVLDGKAQVEKYDYRGNRNIFATLLPGQLFAESFAFSDIEILTVQVRAAEDSRVLLLQANDILSNPAFMENLLRAIANKNILFDHRIEVISKRRTREKLLAYLYLQKELRQSSSFVIPYSRQELADYLGVDRSGLSVELHKLERQGILRAQGREFVLLSPSQGSFLSTDPL